MTNRRSSSKPSLSRACALLAFAGCLVAGGVDARVLRVELDRTVPVLGGKAFGDRGGYEMLEGRVYFGFDPDNEANARVRDIALARREADGLVHAWSELIVLRPADSKKRSGTAVFDVANRGRRLLLGGLNRVPLDFTRPATLDPDDAVAFGDGFLLEQGATLVFIGWQYDAPDFAGAMRLRVPTAVGADGTPLRGLVRSDWALDEAQAALSVAAMGHRPHLVADREASENKLTVRSSREGKRKKIARKKWRFDESGAQIELDGGFEAGKIYELVYVAEGPPVVGLGFAAYRDIASYAVREKAAVFAAKRALGVGSSQSGRFLRHFLHEGFNRDESGRQVYEALLINIAGAGRGGFNHRFSQPGRAGSPHNNFLYPGDDFPFASRPQPTPGGKGEAGLFDRAKATRTLPKIFQVNTGYEYWGRAASLVHTTIDGKRDLAPLDRERLYHLASAPHFPLPFPPRPEAELSPGVFRGSPLDTSSIARAIFLHMLRWVEGDVSPPPSIVPRIGDGTLLAPERLDYPMPGLKAPATPHVAYRLNFGKHWKKGIVDQPPRKLDTYPLYVPALDAIGNERGGIAGVELRVPIGTYVPWAVRGPGEPAPGTMLDFLGSFAPLAVTFEVKQRGDRRPSLAELYPDRAAYDQRIAAALDAQQRGGWLLERDREYERAAAAQRWEWAQRRAAGNASSKPGTP